MRYNGTKLADTLKKLHSTEFEEGALPDSRDTFKNDVKESANAGYFSPKEVKRLYKLADDIPYRNTSHDAVNLWRKYCRPSRDPQHPEDRFLHNISERKNATTKGGYL